MSALSDFRQAWKERFPDSDLPPAWEEDVKANLAKHRAKIEYLKQELEKETFYVEYFERLLSDAEKCKNLFDSEPAGSVNNVSENNNDNCVSGEREKENGGVYCENVALEAQEVEVRDPIVAHNVPSLSQSTSENINKLPQNSEPEILDNSCVQICENIVSSTDNNHVTAVTMDSKESETSTADSLGSTEILHRSDSVLSHCSVSAFVNQWNKGIESTSEPKDTQRRTPPKVPPKKRNYSRLDSTGSSSGQANGEENIQISDAPEPSPIDYGAKSTFTTFGYAPPGLRAADRKGSRCSLNEAGLSAEGLREREEMSEFSRRHLSDDHSEYVIFDVTHQEVVSRVSSFKGGTGPPNPVLTNNPSTRPAWNKSATEKFSKVVSQLQGEILGQISQSVTESKRSPAMSEGGKRFTFKKERNIPHLDCATIDKEFGDDTSDSSSLKGGDTRRPSRESLVSAASPKESPKHSPKPKHPAYVNVDYCVRSRKHGHIYSKGSISSAGSTSIQQSSESVTSYDSDEEPCYENLEILRDLAAAEANLSDEETNSEGDIIFGLPSERLGSEDMTDLDSGVYGSSVDSASFIYPMTPPFGRKVLPSLDKDRAINKSETERMNMYKCIIQSIIDSENNYVECLEVLLNYMKLLIARISTSQPILCLEDINNIFYKIPELHELHHNFLEGLRNRIGSWDGKKTIGDHFKILASKLSTYSSFLQNYPKAIETIQKRCTDSLQFSDIAKGIKLKSAADQVLSLEDLIHKPVAKIQKNALVLHDLLKYTPESHPDHKTLKTALKMTQCFLSDFNDTTQEHVQFVQSTVDGKQRRLVKNSFIVELSEGHRKLRHLFLFNDVIVCGKQKLTGRLEKHKFAFEVKWYIHILDVTLPTGAEPDAEFESIKENSPADVQTLKSRVNGIRDQIHQEQRSVKDKDQKATHKVSSRQIDRLRKKLAEQEAQLVLASPNLAFIIKNKHGKTYTFFLSSEFEHEQWTDQILRLQAEAVTIKTTPSQFSVYELQMHINSQKRLMKTNNIGSILMKTGKDEELLSGDLHVTVYSVQGLLKPCDMYCYLEVDSYGHFFRKAKTVSCRNSIEPEWNQEFEIELEGSQILRILCYEKHPLLGEVLRGKASIELSKAWLKDEMQEKTVSMHEFVVNFAVKFISNEHTVKRVPSNKKAGVFGVKISTVCRRESVSIPFVVSTCINQVEKRGILELGIYRVSGATSDVQKLKKAFDSNNFEAGRLAVDTDIHAVTGVLKLYFRELPEALFTDSLYSNLVNGLNLADPEAKEQCMLSLFSSLPKLNKEIILTMLDHMVRINQKEEINKMSLHNLATIFGPTLLRPGEATTSSNPSDLAAGTFDVLSQSGILLYYLNRRANRLSMELDSTPETVTSS